MTRLNLCTALALLISAFSANAQDADYKSPPTPQAVPGEFIVKLRTDSANVRSAVSALGGEVVDTLPSINAVVIRAPQASMANAAQWVQGIRQRQADIEYIEPNWLQFAVDTNPNDPMFAQQWGLPQIKAPLAWDTRKEAPTVIVAVIDTGIDYNHPDLKDNMWKNPKEIPANGIDEDANGIVDDVHGANFVGATGTGNPLDDNKHGTHVAGIIAAMTNNGVGVAGTAWKTQLMAVKFLDANGSGSTANAIKAIDYATTMGAHVMNNSWGGGGFSQALKDAITAAHNKGALFAAAAGNSNTDNDASPFYPSSYDVPSVISVMSTAQGDVKSSFSQWGKTSVDLAAPGTTILSTLPNNQYGSLSGTSMATPFVSGAAALVKAANPAWNGEKIKQHLMDTVDKVPALMNVSNGRLNLAKAVAGAPTAACPVDSSLIAYNEFFWPANTTFSSNANVLDVAFTLPKSMIVDITAHGSARRSAGSGVSTFITGLLTDNAAPNVMWTGSYRQGTYRENDNHETVSSTFSLRLPAGSHTAYWKLWLSGFSMQFASANITVRAFPCSMGGKIAAMEDATSTTEVEQGARIIPSQAAGGASLTTIEQQMSVTTSGKR
jgi:subtilisin family serine protease